MKNLYLTIVLSLLCSTCIAGRIHTNGYTNVEEYTLPNGLTVFLSENPEQQYVSGQIVVRASVATEPQDHTGLVYLLSILMEKGTQNIGAIDWEKERPIYEEIIRLYDELGVTTNPQRRQEILALIDRKSEEQSRCANEKEFANLMKHYRCFNVNSSCIGSDGIVYSGEFYLSSIEPWLRLNSERFINPVFRSFNRAVETARREHKKRKRDNFVAIDNAAAEAFLPNSPYAHDMVGLPEHLDNPSLSALIDYYNTWFVANNMALVLVGNFKSEAIKPLIEQTFGRLPRKKLPSTTIYHVADLTSNIEKNKQSDGEGPYYFCFPTFDVTDCTANRKLNVIIRSLLNNDMRTGLLDRLIADETLTWSWSWTIPYLYADKAITCIALSPNVAITSGRTSAKSPRRILFKELKKLRNANTVPDDLLNCGKEHLVRYSKKLNYTLNNTVDSDYLPYNLSVCFILKYDVSAYIMEENLVRGVTKYDVAEYVNKYLSGNCLVIHESGGASHGPYQESKNKYKSLDCLDSIPSPYARQLVDDVVVDRSNDTAYNYNAITVKELYDNVTLHYTPRIDNRDSMFSITLNYNVGYERIPYLNTVATLFAWVGTTGKEKLYDRRLKLQRYGCIFSSACDRDNFTLSILGKNEYIDSIMTTIAHLMIAPQYERHYILWAAYTSYYNMINEQYSPNTVSQALLENVLYGDSSRYTNRPDPFEAYKWSFSGDPFTGEITFTEGYTPNYMLTKSLSDVMGYALDIHYVGYQPIDEVIQVVNKIPLQAQMKAPVSTYRTPRRFNKTETYFTQVNGMDNVRLQFCLPSSPFDTVTDVVGWAFNMCFRQLLEQEYHNNNIWPDDIYSYIAAPERVGQDTYFYCVVDLHPSKLLAAIDIFDNLVNAIGYDSRSFTSVLGELQNAGQQGRPSSLFSASRDAEGLRKLYPDIPSRERWREESFKLTFGNVTAYYVDNIRHRPYAILITGNADDIDFRPIREKYGREKPLLSSSLFN